jgi:excisionase family DNA binding protein
MIDHEPPSERPTAPGPSGGAAVTLQEAADELGVHYMTAYRYVRLGLLAAEKDGGTWRVSREAVEAFRAGASGSAAPTTGSAGGGRRKAPWAERLEFCLVSGDGRGAWNVVEAALAAGMDPEDLYLKVLSPAMASIGTRWEQGEIDIGTEHRASGIALRLVGRLGPRFVRRGRTRGAVLLGAPAGELHALPLAMLADLVRSGGWEVSDLGADVPAPSFAQAALALPRLVACGLSVTTAASLPAAEEAIRAVHERVPGVPVVVGGQAIDDEVAARLGADGVATDGRALLGLLDQFATRRVLGHAEGDGLAG